MKKVTKKFKGLYVGFIGLLIFSSSLAFGTPVTAPDNIGSSDDVLCSNGMFAYKQCPPELEVAVTALAQISILNYQGAFRLPGNVYGVSSLTYQQRPVIGFNASTGGLLINGLGDANSKTLGEFSIPALVKETGGVFANLNMAVNTQPFIELLDQAPVDDNDFGSGRTISGIYEKDGEIIVNYFSYYDGTPWNTDVTVVKRNSTDINASTSDTSGSYKMAGATHAAGWISEIPAEWQAALGGTHISGHSSSTMKTINARHSVGPSAFVFNAADILNPNIPTNGSAIATTAVLDYPLEYHLDTLTPGQQIYDRLNDPGTMWNNLSEAGYGFILPGTSTYMVIGGSGGHAGGVEYHYTYPGETQESAGHTPTIRYEFDNHYWLYDVNDLIAVKNGTIQPYEPVPYAHGPFTVPFATTDNFEHRVVSATYDKATGLLYMAIGKIDNQGVESSQPVIVAFTLDGV